MPETADMPLEELLSYARVEENTACGFIIWSLGTGKFKKKLCLLYCTISRIRKLPRNWSSIGKCHRLQVSLLCNLDNLLSILAVIFRACALTCATETDNTTKRQTERENIYFKKPRGINISTIRLVRGSFIRQVPGKY